MLDIQRQSSHSPNTLVTNNPEARFTEKKNPTIPRMVGVEISPNTHFVILQRDWIELNRKDTNRYNKVRLPNKRRRNTPQ